MSIGTCQGIWKVGNKSGQRCDKKVKLRNYCNYHHRMAKKNNFISEQDNRKVSIIETKSYRCLVCENNIDKSFSQISLGCGHKYHYNCFMLMMEDKNGFIFNRGKCFQCNYDIINEMSKECSICHESLIEDIHKTECGHSYHKNCLDSWIKKSKTCPLCRKKL